MSAVNLTLKIIIASLIFVSSAHAGDPPSTRLSPETQSASSEDVAEAAEQDPDNPWTTPDSPNTHYLLTSLELGATLAAGAAWYWLDRERQVADWDFPSWKSKLSFDRDIFIFDNNPFMVNYSWHAFAGTGSHVTGRANGLGMYQAAGMGFASSIVWEYGIESRELISLNDIIVTNTIGVAAGEFFHRLGQYAHAPGRTGAAWKVVQWTLGLPHAIHGKWDRSVEDTPTLWPSFRFSYGLSYLDGSSGDGASQRSDNRLMHSVAFDGTLVALEHYMQPGVRSGMFWKGNFTSFRARYSRANNFGLGGAKVYSDTFLAGFRSENIPEEGAEEIGYEFNLGTSIGYRYQREKFGLWKDRLGGLHAPGLAVEGSVFGDAWRLRWRGRAHFDVMGVNAQASKRWNEANLDVDAGVIGKSILLNSGYYYAWGASATARVELELPIVTLGSNLFVGQYYSIEGYDRIRNEGLAFETRANDEFFDVEAWVRAPIYGGIDIELRASDQRRNGQLGDLFSKQSLRRYTLEVGSTF